MTAIDTLMKKLKWLSESEACWLLEIYGWQFHNVAVQQETWQTSHFTSPREVYLDRSSAKRLGIATTIRFFGGPPGWKQFYWGNWVMFAIDKILYAQAAEDIGFKWILEFDPLVPDHIRDQLAHRLPQALKATG